MLRLSKLAKVPVTVPVEVMSPATVWVPLKLLGTFRRATVESTAILPTAVMVPPLRPSPAAMLVTVPPLVPAAVLSVPQVHAVPLDFGICPLVQLLGTAVVSPVPSANLIPPAA